MKKIVRFILILTILKPNIVSAQSKWDKEKVIENYSSPGIIEETLPKRNKNNKIIGINTYIEIPDYIDSEELIISPDIFGAINEYLAVKEDTKVTINLHIKNNSKYIYSYKDNSLVICTEDLDKFVNNYETTNFKGFDQKNIYEIYYPYRVINTAIYDLYKASLKTTDLTDDLLDKLLKDKGYSGLKEINKYYLDYYNNKYHLKETKLEDFTNSTINEIFTGKISQIKESNKEIIELAYNYFYNKVLTLSFDKQKVTSSNSENYSLASFINSTKGNNKFKTSFTNIKDKRVSLNKMTLGINYIGKNSIYKFYNYSGHLEFILKKGKEKSADKYVLPTLRNNYLH